jgi:hypothetical protein
MDARDQTAMWNADRGDRINMWQQNRVDQRGQDDWRKEVALKQLGLTEQGMNWNREDTAAERAAKYGYMGEELGLRRQAMESDNDYRKRMIALQESDPNRQMGSYALEKMKGRDVSRSNLRSRIASGQGLENMDPQAAAYLRMVAETGDDDTLAAMLPQIAARPLEQKFRREDQRSAGAEEAAARLEEGRYAGEREAGLLKSRAARGGVTDVLAGRGQVVPPEQVRVQSPEYSQIVDSIKSTFRGLDAQATGDQEAAAASAIMQQSIQSAAQELAKQYGTNPQLLAKLIYQDVISGVNVDKRTFLSNPLTFWADTQRETAANALREQFVGEQ